VKLNIGFDAKRIVRNGTGLGSYGRTLVNDLAMDEELQLLLYAPDAGRDDLRLQINQRPNVQFVFSPHTSYPFASLQKAYWRTHGVVSQLLRDGVQVFHGLSGELPIGIRQSGVRSVVTIHDLIFLRHPEYYNWLDVKLYTWKFRRTMAEADCIVAISECTKRDIVEFGGIDPSRIQIVYQSCAPKYSTPVPNEVCDVIRQRYRLPRRYMLSVGTIEERKNLLLAVKALRHLPSDVALVAVGRQTPYTKQLTSYAQNHGLTDRVLLLHNIGNDELPAFYAMAELFVYPSRYEGFGIPIIEAISSGLPVVACTGSCLEEAGGPDSLYVHPNNDEALAAAATHLLRGAEAREERIRRSREYITRFMGTSVASQMADIYRSLVSE
jgi:glycosyltransferase involved in cell wall biosynthesis